LESKAFWRTGACWRAKLFGEQEPVGEQSFSANRILLKSRLLGEQEPVGEQSFS
jgi:hypothetical protein